MDAANVSCPVFLFAKLVATLVAFERLEFFVDGRRVFCEVFSKVKGCIAEGARKRSVLFVYRQDVFAIIGQSFKSEPTEIALSNTRHIMTFPHVVEQASFEVERLETQRT